MNAFISLLKRSLYPGTEGLSVPLGYPMLRVGVGLMFFYIHGWHKLEGGFGTTE